MNVTNPLQRLFFGALTGAGAALCVMFVVMILGIPEAAAHSVDSTISGAHSVALAASAPAAMTAKPTVRQAHATEIRVAAFVVSRGDNSDTQNCDFGCCMRNSSCSSAGGCGASAYLASVDVDHCLTDIGMAALWPRSIVAPSRNVSPPARPPKHHPSV